MREVDLSIYLTLVQNKKIISEAYEKFLRAVKFVCSDQGADKTRVLRGIEFKANRSIFDPK